MYAIMFEAKNQVTQERVNNILVKNGFSKCALPSSNIYRHKGNDLTAVYMTVNELIREHKGDLTNIFVCKMDDISDFSDKLS